MKFIVSLSWWHDWGLFNPASYLPENVVVWWEPVVRQSHCCIYVILQNELEPL